MQRIFAMMASVCWLVMMPAMAEAQLPAEKAQNISLPDGSLPAADNGQFTFADYKDSQALLVNFWATWCAPCIHELPQLDEAARQLADDDIAVILISVDRKGSDHALSFLRERGITDALFVHDTNNDWARHLRLNGLPSSYLISADQSDIYFIKGTAEWAEPSILDEIKTLIGR